MPCRRYIRRLVLSGAVAMLALAGCGGSGQSKSDGSSTSQPSKEDKALAQVCDARASIRSQIDGIRALPATRSSVSKLADGAKVIRTDLEQISNAQDDLAPDRKQQVEAAGKSFGNDVKQVAGEAAASGLTGNAGTAVRDAADQLATSFKQALAPIDCS
jgi:hypothetical protein